MIYEKSCQITTPLSVTNSTPGWEPQH